LARRHSTPHAPGSAQTLQVVADRIDRVMYLVVCGDRAQVGVCDLVARGLDEAPTCDAR
jgi:hypothetical protein